MIWLLRVVVLEALLGATLFGAAGRMDLPWFWTLLAIHFLAASFTVLHVDSDLLQERIKPGPGGVDRGLRWLLAPFLVASLAIAGLDVGRFGWSGEQAWWVHAAGLVVYDAGLLLAVEAFLANQFFSPVVRVQEERGHRLVSSGPYRFVRHPGYAGTLLATLATAPLLGSWWLLVPLAPAVVLLFRRVVIEERYLRDHLEGYVDYARRVRYRLVPWLW